MSNYQLICADARALPLEDESVDCIVTSPPYWGLRDYKLKGQIGLEPTIEEYVTEIGKCLKEMYRVLKKTGTLWLNVGDTYAGSWGSESKREDTTSKIDMSRLENMPTRAPTARMKELPRKSLCLIPDRIRLLMVEQGWIIRNKNIWHKPNAMPSSVKDRFSNAYEDVIFAVKRQKYWFDLDAVREPHSLSTHQRLSQDISEQYRESKANEFYENIPQKGGGSRKEIPEILKQMKDNLNPAGKNPGDVWTINTEPYPKAHYATFPQKLVKKCLQAGCPKEICTKCGIARVRITEPSEEYKKRLGKSWHKHKQDVTQGNIREKGHIRTTAQYQTIGWTDCGCGQGFRPGVMLDPFCGSGTALKVAIELGLDVIGIDKKQEYLDQHAKKRIGGAQMPLIK